MEWTWDKAVAGQPFLDGNLARLFKNEEVKQPGILALNAPSPDATLLTREMIQNSWDAGRELATEFADAGRPEPQFGMDFEFIEWTGGEKAQKIRVLGLDQQSDRITLLDGEPSKVGLPKRSCLDHLGDETPLRVLRITEHRTTGMRGAWSTGASRMAVALLALGVTPKRVGAGGSFGYGKAGLIRGSAIRSLVAYSCFAPTSEESVTRRLLGMSYWGSHELNGAKHTGFGRLGVVGEGGLLEPFEDAEADEAALELGLNVRTAVGWEDDPDDLGTTFLLIDPPFDAEDLSRAVARNWWPALKNPNFVIRVTGSDGVDFSPRPEKDEQLQAFVETYKLLQPESSEPGEHQRISDLVFRHERHNRPLGRLALTSGEWSYPLPAQDDAEQVSHKCLVALVRGPQMVVEYLVASGKAPYLRGVFVADPLNDDLLRQTEPKAHDSWDETASDDGADGIDPLAPLVAKRVHERVRKNVREFQRELRPPLPKPSDVRLTLLEELFEPLTGGKGGRKPPPDGERNFVIRPKPGALTVRDDGLIETSATVGVRLGKLALSKMVAGGAKSCEVKARFVYVESDGMGSEIGTASASLVLPGGEVINLESTDGWINIELERLEGDPAKSSKIKLSLISQPYSADATCRFVVDVRESKAEKKGEANAINQD